MVTPTTDDGTAVDESALAEFTESLVDGGVHALFPCGSIGEFSSLARAQRRTVVETVASNAETVPVLAGCGGTSLCEVRALIDDAAAAGADAAVVVTPYYLQSDQDGLVDFYERLAETSALPMFLYDIPALTGNDLAPESVATLARTDGIIGIEDSTGDLIHHQALIERTPESFIVLQGLTELAIPSLHLGCDGTVSGPANVYPDVVTTIYETYRDGDVETAIDRWNRIPHPVVAATQSMPAAVGLKYLLRRRGFDVGPPLPPLSSVSRQEADELDACYELVESRLE